jgi:bifunctional pyridoxal-dependent enzyme with beta-cystathionase and maltose regulon repressor activities
MMVYYYSNIHSFYGRRGIIVIHEMNVEMLDRHVVYLNLHEKIIRAIYFDNSYVNKIQNYCRSQIDFEFELVSLSKNTRVVPTIYTVVRLIQFQFIEIITV